MALTFDSKVKELLESPEAVEICKNHGMDLTDKRIKIVSGWSWKIDNLSTPKFDKFTLPQEKED